MIKMKFNTFDGSKDLLTLFILVMSLGITIGTFISSDINSWSYVVPIIGFAITMDKTFILVYMSLLTMYAIFQIYVSRSVIHNKIMIVGFGLIFAYVYFLVWNGIIIGASSSGLLILLGVALGMTYINFLHKT